VIEIAQAHGRGLVRVVAAQQAGGELARRLRPLAWSAGRFGGVLETQPCLDDGVGAAGVLRLQSTGRGLDRFAELVDMIGNLVEVTAADVAPLPGEKPPGHAARDEDGDSDEHRDQDGERYLPRDVDLAWCVVFTVEFIAPLLERIVWLGRGRR
jgi:hypothetical protein